MSNLKEKPENFKNAVSRLQESVEEYALNRSPVIRDGAIQRFEFCVELAWKTTKAFLHEKGLNDLNSPKIVMHEAFIYEIIQDENIWEQMLQDRNITPNICDDAILDSIFKKVCSSYLMALKDLSSWLWDK